jgi:hypothetical protein
MQTSKGAASVKDRCDCSPRPERAARPTIEQSARMASRKAVSPVDCCERGGCASDVRWRRISPARKELRNGSKAGLQDTELARISQELIVSAGTLLPFAPSSLFLAILLPLQTFNLCWLAGNSDV